MSNLFDFRIYETEFKGKKVSMEVRPLKSRELADLLPFFMTMSKKASIQKGTNVVGIKKDMKFTFDDPEDIKTIFAAQEKSLSILPNAVRNLIGVDDPWQTICEEVYYLPLVMDILVKLVAVSSLMEGEIKNSEGPSNLVKSDAPLKM